MMDSSCFWSGDLAAGEAAGAGRPPSLASLLSAIQRIAAMSLSVNILSDLSGRLQALCMSNGTQKGVAATQTIANCLQSSTECTQS